MCEIILVAEQQATDKQAFSGFIPGFLKYTFHVDISTLFFYLIWPINIWRKHYFERNNKFLKYFVYIFKKQNYIKIILDLKQMFSLILN